MLSGVKSLFSKGVITCCELVTGAGMIGWKGHLIIRKLMMKKIPVDQCPPGSWLDLAAAQAAGYVRVPLSNTAETARREPGSTECVYALTEDLRYSPAIGVWRRKRSESRFFLWQPSVSITDAWGLAVEAQIAVIPTGGYILDPPGQGDWLATPHAKSPSLDATDDIWSDWEKRYSDCGSRADDAPLAITRTYLKIRGVVEIEVSE